MCWKKVVSPPTDSCEVESAILLFENAERQIKARPEPKKYKTMERKHLDELEKGFVSENDFL